MAFPEYTKLRRYDREVAICPHCGQLIKTKYHDDGPNFEDYDEYHGSINSWYTCKCKNCKISGDGSNSKHYSLADQSAWKFPKGYEITATQKQNNYIAFLAGELQLYYNYIANKEVAGEIIRQLLAVYNLKIQRKLFDKRIVQCFDPYWSQYSGRESDRILHFYKHYQLKFNSIVVELEAKVEKENPSNVQFDYHINSITDLMNEEQRRVITENIFNDFATIKEKLSKLVPPTEAEASAQIESDKEDFKKHCSSPYNEDYDDYDTPDFGDLC